MIKNTRYLLILLPLLALFNFSSCKKPLVFSNGNLNFSLDTLVFDTVFTTVGSTTEYFKFYNPENRTVNVEQIQLMGGENSPFRINVDGVPGTTFADIEMEGDDSLFVFVEVTLDVNNGILPLIVEDSIRFRTNGVDQYVNLAVWGQDAYFYDKDFLDTQTWPNDKPHVIYNYVVVNPNQTLTIPPGTEIFLHNRGILYVDEGTLDILGSAADPVTFQGDRLEQQYDDVSGQYFGIYLDSAKSCTINHCNMINGTAGVWIDGKDPATSDYALKITNSEISNFARFGIIATKGGDLNAENCVFARNSFNSLNIRGSNFRVNHCNLLGYSNSGESSPSVGISNFFPNVATNSNDVYEITEGIITNSIIYGSLEQELAFDTIQINGVALNYQIESNLIRYENQPSNIFYQNNIWNQEPLFVNANEGDYLFYSTSPFQDIADPGFGLTSAFTIGLDIRGEARLSSPYDLGAYDIP